MKNEIKNNINSRVIIIQKLYSKLFNKDETITFPKHRFKKFIKDVVNGTIERDEVINDEILNLEKNYINSSFKQSFLGQLTKQYVIYFC